jgi:hypothetical protein
LVLFYGGWLTLVVTGNHWHTIREHWGIAVAMTMGSYAAGATPMGGGTVGFPVLLLLFKQAATLGRDFSFAVQSIGMTSASIFIICRRQPVEWPMVRWAMGDGRWAMGDDRLRSGNSAWNLVAGAAGDQGGVRGGVVQLRCGAASVCCISIGSRNSGSMKGWHREHIVLTGTRVWPSACWRGRPWRPSREWESTWSSMRCWCCCAKRT